MYPLIYTKSAYNSKMDPRPICMAFRPGDGDLSVHFEATPAPAIEVGRRLILEAKKLTAEARASERAHEVAMRVLDILRMPMVSTVAAQVAA